MFTTLIIAAVTATQPVTADTICPRLGETGQLVMENRQDGVAMSEQMGALEGEQNALANVIRGIIRAAYEEPRWNTEENQRRAVEEFRNEIESNCYEAFADD